MKKILIHVFTVCGKSDEKLENQKILTYEFGGAKNDTGQLGVTQLHLF